MLLSVRLVMLGFFSACFSVCVLCSTMYQVSVECCVGVWLLDWKLLQLVLLVVNIVFVQFFFFAILGCCLFCLNFNFYGFHALLLGYY